MGLIKRKTKQGGVSSGKAGAWGGLAALVALAVTKFTSADVTPEDVATITAAAGVIVSILGQRIATERVEKKLEEREG